MTWSAVAGLGISAASLAAFLFVLYRLLASRADALLRGARLGDQLAAEVAAGAATREALAKSERAYAALHDIYSKLLDSTFAALPDADLVAAAGGSDGLLEPSFDADDPVGDTTVVPAPPG